MPMPGRGPVYGPDQFILVGGINCLVDIVFLGIRGLNMDIGFEEPGLACLPTTVLESAFAFGRLTVGIVVIISS